jgi:alpha-N-arabinofuranosidase
MAASAQAINVLQSLMLTDRARSVLTPTYHVFEMYAVHRDATQLPVELRAPAYTLGKVNVPSLQASASRDKQGVVHLSLVNLDPKRSATLRLDISGTGSERISGRVLTAASMNALNTFEAKDSVKPVPFTGIQRQGAQVTLDIPSKSVTVLDIQ